MKGAPRIAPNPTSASPRAAPMGIDVSGRVVPIAARTLPTAPSDRFRRLPSHSIALVKRAQAPSVNATDATNRRAYNSSVTDGPSARQGPWHRRGLRLRAPLSPDVLSVPQSAYNPDTRARPWFGSHPVPRF